MRKILLIDGNNILHRAYHGLPLLKTANGAYTNAVYGFLMMLQKVLEQETPTHVAICFDKGKNTFRHQKFSDYKAQRKPTDPELVEQFPLIREVLTLHGYTILEMEAFEADDIIGTLAKEGQSQGDDVIIFSGDKDLLQMLDSHIRVISGKKSLTDLAVITVDDFRQKYELEPKKLIDLKGLMGDPSDNIPGVAGVGEKTALKLLHQYGSMEELYAHIEELPKNKMREKLEADKDNAFLSKELATIVDHVNLDISLDDLQPREKQWESLKHMYKELEFRSLLRSLESITPKKPREESMDSLFGEEEDTPIHVDYSEISDHQVFFEALKKEESAALLWQNDFCVFALKNRETARFSLDLSADREFLKQIFSFSDIKLITMDFKGLLHRMRELDISVANGFEDLEIMAYLLDSTTSNYTAESLIDKYLAKDLFGLNDGEKYYASTGFLFSLCETMQKQMDIESLSSLYFDMEKPLVTVLADMEATGVRVNSDTLKEMSAELEQRLQEITANIYKYAGTEFNINSPKQMSEVLFVQMELPHGKKTKTGFSTNNEVLESLEPYHPIIGEILLYRQLAKLKSTYTDALGKLISPKDGCIHTIFRQTVTTTGRLSSTDPNLQNIPVRLEEGRRIRKAFSARDDEHILFAADYSQIELRILAHYAGDKTLIDAFLHHADIHAKTAAEIFDVPLEEVDKSMRRKAKAVNFGIVYGISDYGLGRDLGISRKEAKAYIDKYFHRYPGVEAYLKNAVALAKKQGYVTTLMGRRRYLPDINHRNANLRSFAERTAMNTPIQGTAADVIKCAMVKLFAALSAKNLQSKILLQVHDELILDCPKEELEEVAVLVKDVMEQAVELAVPLIVDMKAGSDWYSLKSYEV